MREREEREERENQEEQKVREEQEEQAVRTDRPPGNFPDRDTGFYREIRGLRGFIMPLLLLVLLMIYGWTPHTSAKASEAEKISRPDAIAGRAVHTDGSINGQSGGAPVSGNPDNPDSPDNPDNPDGETDNPENSENSPDNPEPEDGEDINDAAGQEISWRLRDGRVLSTWADGDTRYVFLPSYAHLVYMSALVRDPLRISLDGHELTDKSDLSRYAIGEPYTMRVRRSISQSYTCTLYFLRSANIPAMYIDTPSGGMDAIHADRDYRESVRVALVGTDGTRLYSGVNDTLKGRGQSSWASDKKSYSLRLQKPKGLLGMAPDVKWALISNTYDHTSLRNKFVMDFAAETGLEWTPSCEYVDLYLNGDYAGLYLLSERVEDDVNRLNLPANRRYTNFLCKVEIYNRWDTLDQPFLTDSIRTVELVSPKPASELELFRVNRDVQLLENTILSGNERALLRYLDLDSWVRRYLIDEITENLDADLASSYFYCIYDGNRPVFYGGPIWDYDATFDNASPYRNINPGAFVANAAWEAEGVPTPWFYALYQYPVFYNRVRELYQAEFRPLLERSLDRLEALYKTIRKSSEMNKIRWYGPDEDISERRIQYFIMDRAEFLDKAWIQGVNYHNLQIEPYPGQYYLSYAVRDGDGFTDFPDASITRTRNDDGTEQEIIWYDRETGIIYEPGRPIEKDTILVRWNPKPPVLTGPEPEGASPVPISPTPVTPDAGNADSNHPDGHAEALSSESAMPYPEKTGGASDPNPENSPSRPTPDPGSDPEARQREEEKKTPVPWQESSMLVALLFFEFLGVTLFLLIHTDAGRQRQEGIF